MRRSLLGLLAGSLLSMAGLGGQNPAPQNAPGSLTPAVGVQPGTTNIIRARQVIVSGSGDFVLMYSGAPALGNLTGSISPVQFTDSKGNLVLQGITSYEPGPPSSAVQVNNNLIAFFTAATEAGPWTQQNAIVGAGSGILEFTGSGFEGLITIPQAAPSDFPVSGSATLATTIAALNQLETLLVTAGVIA